MLLVDSLTKRFSLDDGFLTAVDSVSFQIQPGEVFGLLGPNGAGKTTTMRMIFGASTARLRLVRSRWRADRKGSHRREKSSGIRLGQ